MGLVSKGVAVSKKEEIERWGIEACIKKRLSPNHKAWLRRWEQTETIALLSNVWSFLAIRKTPVYPAKLHSAVTSR